MKSNKRLITPTLVIVIFFEISKENVLFKYADQINKLGIARLSLFSRSQQQKPITKRCGKDRSVFNDSFRFGAFGKFVAKILELYTYDFILIVSAYNGVILNYKFFFFDRWIANARKLSRDRFSLDFHVSR